MMHGREIILPLPLKLEAGGELRDVHVAYHTSAHERREGEKVILICHGFTASSDAEDWWPGMVGKGKALDTETNYVVCVNQIGSPYGSTSPLSTDPSTGERYLGSFPDITIRDVAATVVEVCRAEHIAKVDLLVGASVGGYIAYELCSEWPSMFGHVVFLATAPRVSPYITAYNEAQRMAIEADPTFGRNSSPSDGKTGLESARAIALISYRSYDGYDATQCESDDDTLYAQRACTYERYQGRKFSARFDAYCYMTLLRTIDSHNVGRGRGGVRKVLAGMRTRCTVIGIVGDCIFPVSRLREHASVIPGASYREIRSSFGHDGFLLENEQLSEIINDLI